MNFKHIVACLVALMPAFLPAEDRGVSVRAIKESAVSIPTYHALVIGINDYQHWQKLRQARKDAESLADILKKGYGFADVRTLLDGEATRSAILDALYDFLADRGPADSLLIYYAGHGFYDKNLESGYWIPADGREPVRGKPVVADWIQDVYIRELLSKTKARHVLVLSDACFSGSLLRGEDKDLMSKENTVYQKAIEQPVRWMLTSGDIENVPDDSVFSGKILQLLQYPRQEVFDAEDMGVWIKKEIAESTGCQPRSGQVNTGLDNPGQFVFIVKDKSGLVRASPQAQPANAASRDAIAAKPPPLPDAGPEGTVKKQGTNRILFSSPGSGRLKIGSREYDLSGKPQVDLPVGRHPFELSVSGRPVIYGTITVHFIDDETEMATFGLGSEVFFRDRHVEAATAGQPVRYSIDFTGTKGRKEAISYVMSLHKPSK